MKIYAERKDSRFRKQREWKWSKDTHLEEQASLMAFVS